MDRRVMQGFEPVTLSWQGQDYVVPANRQLMLIAEIEDVLGGKNGEQAISVLFRKAGVQHSRLASAYGAALRYAGAKVTDEQVYLNIHQDIANGSREEVLMKTQLMIMGLLAIISPPVAAAARGDAPEKKASPAA